MSDRVMYYTYGIMNHGTEVIDALVAKGGKHTNKLIVGDSPNHIYLINYNGDIDSTPVDSYLAETLKCYGKKVVVYPTKVLSWNDVMYSKDTYSIGLLGKRPYEELLTRDSTRFATEQQARSAEAAAIISQIRAQGKESYGRITPPNNEAFHIYKDCNDLHVTADCDCVSGLLRFDKYEQAELFLEENEHLVRCYLNTFA